jgi:transcriptional regulator with XRE-family HTH domain
MKQKKLVGHTLKTMRVMARMNRNDVARKGGICLSTVYNSENAASSPSTATLKKYAKAFGMKPDRLIEILDEVCG